MDYRFAGKRRTLALGVYPVVTLSSARTQREQARLLLAQGADPSASKQRTKRLIKLAGENTFEAVSREWLANQRNRLSQRYCGLLLARLTRLALRSMVLTFARTTELRAARWSEFENLDGNEPLWRIPAERTKMKREHIVPLAPQAVAVLRELRALPDSENSPLLFPSPSREGHMSNNTMLYALYRVGYHGRATVHGFRAMASTALNEMGFRPDVIERQLAHQEKNAVRAAYNRAEYFAERRAMMKHWADYLDVVATGHIVPFKAKFGSSQ